MHEKLTLKIIGDTPYIPHNGQMIDPLNQYSKRMREISKKRPKTDADLEEMAKTEFLGGLYLYDGKPCIPGEVLEAAIGAGARKSKAGKQASAGVFVKQPALLEYDGPSDSMALWEDGHFALRVPVRIGRVSIMRVRPIFRDWSATFVADVNTDLVNAKDVKSWVRVAGLEIGIGDWRPQTRGHYGLFVLAE